MKLILINMLATILNLRQIEENPIMSMMLETKSNKNIIMSLKGSKDLDLVLLKSLQIQRSVRLARCHLDNVATVKHMCQETKVQHMSRI